MVDQLINRFTKGARLLLQNNQLLYTIAVAIIIFTLFFLVVNRFIIIAEEAHDKLTNVRVGSIQDGFVAFAPDHIDDINFITAKMRQMQELNPTINQFIIVEEKDEERTIIASLDPEDVGVALSREENTLLDISLVDKQFSHTISVLIDGERVFVTARYFEIDEDRSGYILTTQSTSAAEKEIERAITRGVAFFVVIIVVITLLFFRFARVIDYATLYRKLREIDQLKDDFIAMASHELRSPLTSIRGYLELMVDSKDGLSDEQREYAKRVDSSAAHLNDLVGDMLDVSRMEQGRMKFEYSDFDIEEVVTEVIESFTPVAEKKGLTLVKDGLKEIIVHADRDKLKRVIINLVSNAIKYTPKGEVKVLFKVDGEMIEIRVSDSGIGISKEDQENLFGKFYRVKSAETSEIQGTGLGLWLSREIIRTLGGDITVESIKGVGTHFIVRIPAIRKEWQRKHSKLRT